MLFIVLDMWILSEKHSLVPADRGVCVCAWARLQSDGASEPEFKSFVIMVNHTHYSCSLFLELHQHCPVLHNRGNFHWIPSLLPPNSQLSCLWIPTVSTNWDENRPRARMCVLGEVQNNLLFYYQTKLQPDWCKIPAMHFCQPYSQLISTNGQETLWRWIKRKMNYRQ